MRCVAVVPCRFGASRFPGKPLARLGGRPLLWYPYQQALLSPAVDYAVIATDDERIESECRELGIPVVMTGQHATGTDRVAECARLLDADVYVNVQGDEPFVDPAAITAVADALLKEQDPRVAAANGCSRLDADDPALHDCSVVKAVRDCEGRAMFFSRLPIPYPKGPASGYVRQLGLYAFRREALELFSSLPRGPIESAEDVEMLRFLEHGHLVQTVDVQHSGVAVDTPQDLMAAERQLATPS